MPAIAPLFNLFQPTANPPSGSGNISGSASSFPSFFGQAVAHFHHANHSSSGHASTRSATGDPGAQSATVSVLKDSDSATSRDSVKSADHARANANLKLEPDQDLGYRDGTHAMGMSWSTGNIDVKDSLGMPESGNTSATQDDILPVVTVPGVNIPSDMMTGSSIASHLSLTANGLVEDNIPRVHEISAKTTSAIDSTGYSGQPNAVANASLRAGSLPAVNEIVADASSFDEPAASQKPLGVHSDLAAPNSPMGDDTSALVNQTSTPQKTAYAKSSSAMRHAGDMAFGLRNTAATVSTTERNALTQPTDDEVVSAATTGIIKTEPPATRPFAWTSVGGTHFMASPSTSPGIVDPGTGNMERLQGPTALQGAVVHAEFISNEPPRPQASIAQPQPMNGRLDHLGQLAENSRILTSPPETAASAQPGGGNTGALLISIENLTSLKPQTTGNVDRSADRVEVPLRQQFREHMQQMRSENSQDEPDLQSQTGRQDQSGAPLPTSSAQTTGPSQFSETVAMTLPGQTAIGQPGASPQPNAPVQTPAFPQPLHDNLVYQQVAGHFQLQMRNQQTRLHIQLQPAELGKMAIQLTVKEGSVRAQVMVQSGQVQEILERNLTKLRTILEQQGFSVENLVVEQQTETPAEMNLSQEQLARHQTQKEPQQGISEVFFSDTLEDAVNTFEPPQSGVNITA